MREAGSYHALYHTSYCIIEDQDEFLMRNSEHTEVGLETNNRALLEDVGQNADLYIANQEANTQP